jgi:hypothetical protein
MWMLYRFSLWVIGHAQTLQNCPPWANFLGHMAATKSLFLATQPFDDILDRPRSHLQAISVPRNLEIRGDAHSASAKRTADRGATHRAPCKKSRQADTIPPHDSAATLERSGGQNAKAEQETAGRTGKEQDSAAGDAEECSMGADELKTKADTSGTLARKDSSKVVRNAPGIGRSTMPPTDEGGAQH